MFKSLRFYRIHGDWPDSETALADRLEAMAFKPCGTFTEQSMGFEPPVEDEAGLLARRVAGADLLQLRVQTKVLPSAAVKEALDDRIVEYRQRTHTMPNRKEKRDLKDEVYAELLPRAFVRSERIRVVYFVKDRILGIASPVEKTAEAVLEVLREALGSLHAVPLAYKRATHTLLTQIFMGDGPEGYGLGRECRMREAGEPSSNVSWNDMDLADRSVRKHISEGLELDRLAVQFDGILRCTIDGDLVIRKLCLEGIEEDEDFGDDEDPIARHDAEFTLWAGLVAKLLDSLRRQLGGYAT